MAAYIIAEIEVNDPAGYEEYKEMVPGSIARHGGRYLVRGPVVEQVEGDWPLKRLAIVEFPNAQRARDWWNSADYRPARDLRQRTARTRMILVEGVAPGTGGKN